MCGRCGASGGCTLHGTLYTLHFTSALHIPFYTLHYRLRTPHFTLHTLHSTLDTSHSTISTSHPTRYIPHSTLHCLHTPHSALHSIPHSTVYTDTVTGEESIARLLKGLVKQKCLCDCISISVTLSYFSVFGFMGCILFSKASMGKPWLFSCAA